MAPHRERPKRIAPDGGAPARLDRLTGGRGIVTIASDGPERTFSIGRAIGALLPRGAVVSLEGGLGAGKTVIAKGICAGLGVSDEVLSPSFVLAEEYAGVFPVLHFDLYRLDSVDEVERIGLFDAVDGRSVVIVEWGDRLGPGTLDPDVRVVMEIAGERGRTIRVEGARSLVARLEGEPA
jgi:tRNA threonylcarbamoyladenosine biosynthesis protein TsaE